MVRPRRRPAARPDAPGGVYLGGRPEADLGHAVVGGPATRQVLFLGNFEPGPIEIRGVRLEGDDAFGFPDEGPLTPDCHPEMAGHGILCLVGLTFAPKTLGRKEAALTIDYALGGGAFRLRRHLHALAITGD